MDPQNPADHFCLIFKGCAFIGRAEELGIQEGELIPPSQEHFLYQRTLRIDKDPAQNNGTGYSLPDIPANAKRAVVQILHGGIYPTHGGFNAVAAYTKDGTLPQLEDTETGALHKGKLLSHFAEILLTQNELSTFRIISLQAEAGTDCPDLAIVDYYI
ncbi:MAG: hypothetical protein AAFP92_16240 [Bacteroidota bacterium]